MKFIPVIYKKIWLHFITILFNRLWQVTYLIRQISFDFLRVVDHFTSSLKKVGQYAFGVQKLYNPLKCDGNGRFIFEIKFVVWKGVV
jgi:hypothetical protein